MAWTQSDLDKIKAAIGTGATRVRFKDHDTEFRSLDDMIKTKELIEKELGISADDGAGISFAEYSDGR